MSTEHFENYQNRLDKQSKSYIHNDLYLPLDDLNAEQKIENQSVNDDTQNKLEENTKTKPRKTKKNYLARDFFRMLLWEWSKLWNKENVVFVRVASAFSLIASVIILITGLVNRAILVVIVARIFGFGILFFVLGLIVTFCVYLILSWKNEWDAFIEENSIADNKYSNKNDDVLHHYLNDEEKLQEEKKLTHISEKEQEQIKLSMDKNFEGQVKQKNPKNMANVIQALLKKDT